MHPWSRVYNFWIGEAEEWYMKTTILMVPGLGGLLAWVGGAGSYIINYMSVGFLLGIANGAIIHYLFERELDESANDLWRVRLGLILLLAVTPPAYYLYLCITDGLGA